MGNAGGREKKGKKTEAQLAEAWDDVSGKVLDPNKV